MSAVCIVVLSAGCAQTTTEEEEFSGFLGDYAQFEEIESGDGYQMVPSSKKSSRATVIRWWAG
jgi:hypothetical protein